MKTSKTLMLATIFSFAVASTSLAGDTPPPAPAKKTYNSGQSTTGYTQANPCCNSTGHPTSGGGSSNKTWGPAGLQQGGGK
jgi:hypothetical protein